MLRTDLLFNFLFGLLAVIVSLLLQINPPSSPEIAPPGNMVVSATWPAGDIDVDLWLAAPGEKAIGYSNKSGKTWSLLRDDLGNTKDITPLNYESAFSRGLPDGEYIINVRCFSCAGAVPVQVNVEVRLAEGALVWSGVVTIERDKQDKTAIRFRMKEGAVVPGSESQVFKQIRGE